MRDLLLKIKLNKKTAFNFILYIAFVAVYLYMVRFYDMGTEIARVRYYILFGITIIGFVSVLIINWGKIRQKGFKFFKERKFLLSIIVAIVFLGFSIYEANAIERSLNIRTYIQIGLFLLPTLYAFVAINLFSRDEIIKLMEITTILLIITYLTEDKHSIIQLLNIDNWLKIDIINSTSFTESHICARAGLILFLFFYYLYRVDKKKVYVVYSVITFILTLLCFKRLDIVFAILTIIFGRAYSFKKKVKPWTIVITTVAVVAITMLYLEFLNGNILKNIDVYHLTSGRSKILELWNKKGALSYGYGSSLLIIRRSIEMDLVQMYMELNWFALLSFVGVYVYISKENIYSYYIMLYILVNMLTASSLANTLAWVVQMIAIAVIATDTKKRLEEKNGSVIETNKENSQLG